jgi:hypothetical protein
MRYWRVNEGKRDSDHKSSPLSSPILCDGLPLFIISRPVFAFLHLALDFSSAGDLQLMELKPPLMKSGHSTRTRLFGACAQQPNSRLLRAIICHLQQRIQIILKPIPSKSNAEQSYFQMKSLNTFCKMCHTETFMEFRHDSALKLDPFQRLPCSFFSFFRDVIFSTGNDNLVTPRWRRKHSRHEPSKMGTTLVSEF